jgi:flavodoxin
MKNTIIAGMAIAVALCSFCNNVKAQDSDQQARPGTKKILVAYFSQTGNTRAGADQIRNATGGDIFEIQPVDPYTGDYQALVDQARKEIDSNYRPALKTTVEDIGSYDVIFVGSPNWWSTIAPPVAAFLTSYDLSGKTIAPFMTHGGGGLGHSVSDIKQLCPKSTVLEGLAINGSAAKTAQAQDDVTKWLGDIKIIE